MVVEVNRKRNLAVKLSIATPASKSSRTQPPWPPALGETINWLFLIAAAPLRVRFVGFELLKSFVKVPAITLVAEREARKVFVKKRIVPQYGLKLADRANTLGAARVSRSPPLFSYQAQQKPVHE